jgi:hypothetical protein
MAGCRRVYAAALGRLKTLIILGCKLYDWHRTLYCTDVSFRYRNVRRTIPTFATLPHFVLRLPSTSYASCTIGRSAEVDAPSAQIACSIRRWGRFVEYDIGVQLHCVPACTPSFPINASTTAPQHIALFGRGRPTQMDTACTWRRIRNTDRRHPSHRKHRWISASSWVCVYGVSSSSFARVSSGSRVLADVPF